jgi:carboxyl-terminal processing protease
MPRRTLWLILAAIVISMACYERAEHNPYGRWFAEAMEAVDRHYVEPVDDQKLFEGALAGMLGRLDDHSTFFPRTEAHEFEESLDQEYGGIGIEVGLEGPEKHLTVMTPLVGTPAYKAGILAGDKIVAINGRSTQNLQLKDIVRLLRGKPGGEVALTVDRKGRDTPLDFHLVRARIQTDSVLGDSRNRDGVWNFFLPGNERIGYVRIVAFGKSTLDEFEAAMNWLRERKCQGLILDMRNNPGGLLDSGEQICDLFLPAGKVIVTTRGRDAQERNRYEATGRGPYQNLPIVVLVNDKSASASEIVAACLQDHGRATVVGQRTWGKGTVQSVIPLEGGKSLLKLTIASYWRPSGKNIHRLSTSQETDEWGVKPDPGCEVKLDEKQTADFVEQSRKFDLMPLGNGSPTAEAASTKPAATSRVQVDRQLERALQVLQEKLSPMPTAKRSAG